MIPLELIREYEKQMRELRIGSTPLLRAQKLEKRLGIRRLHLKLEGANPSGTHKDRMALIYALDARSKGIDTVVAATCGNYGAALAYVCDKLDMDCEVYLPSQFSAPRRPELERMGAKIVVSDGLYEDAVAKSTQDASKKGYYNANAGGAAKELGFYAYAYIAKEIAKDLGRQPDWVSVPVGNGTCFVGVWNGFRSMSMKPRMLGVSNNNSTIRGAALKTWVDTPVPDIKFTEVNEPLAGNVILDSEETISAIVESNGAGIEVPDEELVDASEVIMKEEGKDILPAAAGAVWGITKLESKNHMFVAVLTSRGHLGH